MNNNRRECLILKMKHFEVKKKKKKRKRKKKMPVQVEKKQQQQNLCCMFVCFVCIVAICSHPLSRLDLLPLTLACWRMADTSITSSIIDKGFCSFVASFAPSWAPLSEAPEGEGAAWAGTCLA